MFKKPLFSLIVIATASFGGNQSQEILNLWRN